MTVNEQGATARRNTGPHGRPASKDKKLVGLVRETLVDPNLHTDTRMRLHRAIEILLATGDRPTERRSRRR